MNYLRRLPDFEYLKFDSLVSYDVDREAAGKMSALHPLSFGGTTAGLTCFVLQDRNGYRR